MKFITCFFLSFLSLACFGDDGYLYRTNGNIGIGPGGSGGGSQTPWTSDIDGGNHQLTNTSGLATTNLTVNGTGANFLNSINVSSNLFVTNGFTAYGYWAYQTNAWTTNTAFTLGGTTNYLLLSGANTACGVTGIVNGAPTGTEPWGQLLIVAIGDIVFTNPASIHASDYLTTRTITNGNNAMIAFDVWPGLATNMFISQTK